MSSTVPKKVSARKLLVAAVGVATLNYVSVACTPTPTSGNLPAPMPDAGGAPDPPATTIPPTSGNLPAPPPKK